MLTLDEAIEKETDIRDIKIAVRDRKGAEYHRQLAEWLKELKRYREAERRDV